MVATIKLRTDQLAKLRRIAGITTNDELAKRMRVNPATVSRTLSEQAAPGARFIAGLLDVFGTECFADLFQVVPDDDLEDVA